MINTVITVVAVVVGAALAVWPATTPTTSLTRRRHTQLATGVALLVCGIAAAVAVASVPGG